MFLFVLAALSVRGQQVFRDISLSEALVTLAESSKRYNITFVYDELEEFTVSKTIPQGRSLPDAVREVCGFYPVRVVVEGREIFVECTQKERMKLKGRLVDADNQPVAFANIALFSPEDSALIGGGVSNEAGRFVIPCRAERALVRISCVGYKTIERLMPISQVGTIRMQVADYYLHNVNVKGVVPVIRYDTDRLQYVLADDPFVQGQSVAELMNRVPMVTLSGGRVSILGRGQARWMLDGRVLDYGSGTIPRRLWSLRAEDIERIEVITLPVGSNMVDGGGGYINIVTRRDQTLGWRGDLTGELLAKDDLNWRYGGSVSYATKRLDASLDVYGKRLTERTDAMTTYERQHEFTKRSDSHDEERDREYGANLALHYQLTPRWEAGAMLSYRQNRDHHDMTDADRVRFSVNYAPFSGLGPNIKDYTMASASSLSPTGAMHTTALTAFSDILLDTLGKQANLTYNFYHKTGTRGSIMEGDANIPIYYYSSSDPYHVSNTFELDTDYRIHSLKLDVTLPFPFAKVETGLGYTDIDNTVLKSQEQSSNIDINGIYRNNSYRYQERSAIGYLTVSKQLHSRLSATLGLHLERSWLTGEDRDMTKSRKTKQTFTKLLPTLSANYQLGSRQQLVLQMGRRIDRPDFDELNQVPVYVTMTNLIAGNPALIPGTTDFAELSYRHAGGFYANLWYRHGKDQTVWVTRFQIDQGQRYRLETQTTKPENWLDEHQGGLYLRYQQRFFTWLNTVVEGDLYYYHGSSSCPELGRNEDAVFNPYMPDLHGWGKHAALAADLFLNPQHSLLLNVRYDHWFRQLEKITDISAYGYASLALRYSLMDDCLKLSLVAQDPFRQHVTDLTRPYNWFTERIHTVHHSHFVSLTASYALGGKKVRRSYRDKKDTETQRAENHKTKL
jgi:hypothetical protein